MSFPKNNRILLVDDNPDIHGDYAKILCTAPAHSDAEDIAAFLGSTELSPSSDTPSSEIDSAYSGEEAVQKAALACERKQPYAIAFVDMRMPPGWDGLRTAVELWKTDSNLQIVICTAYSDNSWTDIIDRVGKTDNLLILKKPFAAIEVAQMATALTEKWELARQAQLKREDLERLINQRTQQLQHAALHDDLTDLPNRRCFYMRLVEAIQNQKGKTLPAALALVDLDRFKQVNDSFGHPIGDELLKAVAARLRKYAVPEDTVARLGGDEFALITSGGNESEEHLTERLAKLVTLMSEPYLLPCGDLYCPASVGVSLILTDDEYPEELVRRADLALYRAKRDGRGTLRQFDPDIDSKTVHTRQFEPDLRRAIDEHEFILHYQPIVSCVNGSVAKLEALVRWQHPSRGLLAPADFIPLAEDTSLICEIGNWVLEEACRQAVTWPEHVMLAVNLSAVQFRKVNQVTDSIVANLSRFGLSPERFEVEVTEGVLLQDSDELIATLKRLRGMGVSIVLDDFGIGYSNLNYLRKFPFNKIKLDRAFVREVNDCEDARTIVRAVAKLGRKLRLETTAEGVETERQYDIVRNEGFNFFQGYLCGRPMPDDKLESLMETAATIDFVNDEL